MPSEGIYQPAEDSYLMSDVIKEKIPKFLEKNPNLKFLEIGCGSGINLQTTLERGIKKGNILGGDINPEAVKYCKNLSFNCVVSDLFEKIPKEKFDLIIFNPPYLPLDKNEPEDSRRETTGGKNGNEISIEFLEQAKDYLNEDGKIFLITSSLAEEIDFEELGYNYEKISEKNLFQEKLFVWELIRRNRF